MAKPKKHAKAKPAKRVKAGTSKSAAADRRAKFVIAYVGNGGNASQAAITAGYTAKSSRTTGARMIADANIKGQISAYRSQVLEKAAEKVQLTAEEVMASLARDLRFDPAKLLNEDGSLKSVHEMDEDTRLALRSMEVDEIKADRLVIGHTTKVKFPEKTSAREQGMKHFGLYREDNKQRGESMKVSVMFGPE